MRSGTHGLSGTAFAIRVTAYSHNYRSCWCHSRSRSSTNDRRNATPVVASSWRLNWVFSVIPPIFFFFYRNVNCLEERTVDRGGLNREEKKQTEPTGTMNRVGRTSATKWEASGTAAQVAWRHRVSSLFCHSTASTAREKGACTTSQTPSLHLRDALLLSEVHYRARRNILLDDSPRIYRFRRPNSLAFTYSSR